MSEVQARLDLQAANTLLARHDYLDKQQGLQEIIGYGNVRLHRVRKDLPMAVPQPNDVQVWLRTALEQNWSIRAASAAVAVAEKEVSVQRAGYYRAWRCALDRPQRDRRQPVRRRQHRRRHPRHAEPERAHLPERLHLRHEPCPPASRLGAASSELSLARRKVQRQVFSFQNIVIGMDRIKALNSSVQSFELALRQRKKASRPA